LEARKYRSESLCRLFVLADRKVRTLDSFTNDTKRYHCFERKKHLKGQRALAQQMRDRDAADRARYEAAATAAEKPSAAETQLEADRKAYFDWKAKGDFRTPPPGLIGINYGPEAQRRRQLEQTAVPTGAAGMGAAYASPTALALTRDYLGNVNAENDATAYQGALTGEDMYQRTGNSLGLMSADWARKSTLLGSASGQSQFSTGARIQTQPQSILPALLSAGLQAGGAFLGGPAFAAMMKPATASGGHP